jgi:hypothetical protein
VRTNGSASNSGNSTGSAEKQTRIKTIKDKADKAKDDAMDVDTDNPGQETDTYCNLVQVYAKAGRIILTNNTVKGAPIRAFFASGP